jgi:hypothetical protein
MEGVMRIGRVLAAGVGAVALTVGVLGILAGTAGAADNFGQCVKAGSAEPSQLHTGPVNLRQLLENGKLTGALNALEQSDGHSRFGAATACSKS